jgi:nucleotide-binding universal stress UspA family protein
MNPARQIPVPAWNQDMQDDRQYNMLVPVALPSAGPGLIRAAAALAPPGRDPAVCAVHVEPIPAADTPARVREEIVEIRNEALGSARREAIVLGLPLSTSSIRSGDAVGSIIRAAEDRESDLIVLGWPRPVNGKGEPSPTMGRLLEQCTRDVAVLLNRREPPWRKVLLPFVGGVHDLLAVELVRRIAESGAAVTILHVVDPGRPSSEPPRLRTRETGSFRDERVTLRVVESRDPVAETVREAGNGYDLIVVGVSPTFGDGRYPWSVRHERIARDSEASLLVVRSHRAATKEASSAPKLEEPEAVVPNRI